MTSKTAVPSSPQRRAVAPKQAPSLRPPTLMIDLLFSALMLFAFHMGNPSAVELSVEDIDLPVASDRSGNDLESAVTLRPIQRGTAWFFQKPDGSVVSAVDVMQGEPEGQRAVIIMSATDPIQIYVSAEQALKAHGLLVGMAVELVEEKQ
jgi:hypothetical protein